MFSDHICQLHAWELADLEIWPSILSLSSGSTTSTQASFGDIVLVTYLLLVAYISDGLVLRWSWDSPLAFTAFMKWDSLSVVLETSPVINTCLACGPFPAWESSVVSFDFLRTLRTRAELTACELRQSIIYLLDVELQHMKYLWTSCYRRAANRQKVLYLRNLMHRPLHT